MTTASIVIPSRGGAERLPRLLTALAAQTHHDWEAIVVIDGDIDNSEEVVAQYSHLPIRSVVFPENRGRVAALNAGFEAASGEVLIRCDDDLVPNPVYIAEHIRVAGSGEAGAVGLYLNVLPETPYARVYGRRADELHRQQAYRAPQERRFQYWAGNSSVTREVYDAVGGYDPTYRAYGWEDVDFGYRLQKLGVRIELVPELETPHYVAAVTTAIRASRAIASGRARWTFERLHGVGTSGRVKPDNDSAWNRLVNGLADRLTAQRSARLAALVDAMLPVLPAAVGRKAVAAVVEASGISGYALARENT